MRGSLTAFRDGWGLEEAVLSGQVVVDRYRLDAQIGSGGMGVVWRATDIQLGRVVALKCAHAGGDRSMREAKAAAALHHPNVVTLFDVIEDGGDCWLVMEYLPARDLADIVGQPDGPGEPLAPAEVAGIGAQIAGALRAVHAVGALHRDVKPGNVLITEDGTAKLCDFGISHVDWGDPTLTGAGILGTPAYLAPEVASGEEPTAASDLFALGATLYYAVEGTSPYGAQANPAELIRRAARGQILAPRRAGPLLPLLSEMLRRDPRRRPDAARVAEVFGQLAADADPSAATQPREPHRPAVSRRRGVIAAAAAAVVLIVAATFFVFHEDNGPAPVAEAPHPAPVLGMGEQRTADPCALVDPKALGRFGTVELNPTDGNFNRCDVLITNGGIDVDLATEFANGAVDPDGAQGPLREVHGLQVKHLPAQDDECDREIGLPDNTRVKVTAEDGADNSAGGAPYCAIADAGTDQALAVLGKGQVPRRKQAFAPDSMARVDACALLDAATLRSTVTGVDASHPAPEFGNWECTWRSSTDRLSVDLDYDRDQPMTSAVGTPLRFPGRQAFVLTPEAGDDYCEVDTVNRELKDAKGAPLVETVDIEVSGEQTRAQKCRIATKLARAAAAKLPGRPG